ncbi:MAG: hypothetical protein AAF447_20735 [Myxococcota bacterium]
MAHLRHGERDSVVDAALDAMDAEQLRGLIRALIPWLNDATQARLTNEVVDRAARASSGWVPATPSERRIEEIEAFVAAAKRVHQADPSDVDDYLREGTHAFLARDYASAFRIFRALLTPIGDGDIDLGQHELVDEVLGVDIDACAKQYAVAMYMTSSPKNRARAVCSAIEDVQGVGYFFEPLRELERVAVEPLPNFDDFLAQWQTLVEEQVVGAQKTDWDRPEDGWLREVVARTQGAAGLAELARRSRQADDLRAWCSALVKAGDWPLARAAYEEAEELVEDRFYSRGDFLDGAALAAQELASDDLGASLERAWREAPSLTRLRRWLGACATREELVERAGAALEMVPAGAARQCALLHVLRGELDEAATLLANARGLGWSDAEHPGHLLFPLFVGLLEGTKAAVDLPRDHTDMSSLMADDRPKLRTPTIDALLRLVDLRLPEDESLRASVISAMRAAAEKRVEGVTANKRRRHYGHAASLAVQCARADGSTAGKAWLRELMDEYRRYPALKRAFKAAGS